MSDSTFRRCLAGIAILTLAIIGVSIVRPLLADHDGWEGFRPIVIDVDPLIAQPPDILSARDRETIRHVVVNTDEEPQPRRFGIPWSVAVIRDTEIDPDMEVAEYAETLFDDLEIESSEGADDGMLMAVVIPEGNHTGTSVHFVTGANFYPRGGITPERLRWIADVQMAPMIANNTIGDAIIEGAFWVEWMQLFEPPPRPPAIESTSSALHPLGSTAMAGLTLLIVGAAVYIAVVTRRGDTRMSEPVALDAILASAIAIGRINQRVVAGVVLDGIERGVLTDSGNRLMLPADTTVGRQGRHDSSLTQAMISLARLNVPVSFDRLVRYLGASELPQTMEDELASGGLMHPRSRLFYLALKLAAITGTSIGVIFLVLAVLGEVESTLLAAIALIVASVSVLIWNESHSWTTRAGGDQLARWLAQRHHDQDRDRRLYDTVTQLDGDSDGRRAGAASLSATGFSS